MSCCDLIGTVGVTEPGWRQSEIGAGRRGRGGGDNNDDDGDEGDDGGPWVQTKAKWHEQKRWGSICARHLIFSPAPPVPFTELKSHQSHLHLVHPSLPPALPLNYSFLHLLSAVLLTSAFTLRVWNGLHYFKAPILQQRVEALVQSERQKHLLAMEYAQIVQKAHCGPLKNF